MSWISMHEATEELQRCRVILDMAGDYSTSIHGGIDQLVCQIRFLKARPEQGMLLAEATKENHDLKEELAYVLNDWNALVKAIDAPTNGTAVAHALQLKAKLDEAEKRVRVLEKRETHDYDCRMVGKVAEMSGSHCPFDDPCQRCQLDRADDRIARLERLLAPMLLNRFEPMAPHHEGAIRELLGDKTDEEL